MAIGWPSIYVWLPEERRIHITDWKDLERVYWDHWIYDPEDITDRYGIWYASGWESKPESEAPVEFLGQLLLIATG